MTRVAIRPKTLRWACERARVDTRDLAIRIPQLPAWERGEKQPTLRQLEAFAKTTHTPIGCLFLKEPIEEPVPIADFRTVADTRARHLSPDLLDTIYAMQRRQDWLREERVECETGALEFVGSARLTDDPAAVEPEMRRMVNVDDGWAA